MTLTSILSAYLHCHFNLLQKQIRWAGILRAVVNSVLCLTYAWCLGQGQFQCNHSAIWEWIKSCHGSAKGHSSAQSDFTATELSVYRWELMLSVRCQVELSRPLKGESIVCESPGHCHTTFVAGSRDGTGKAPKVIRFSVSRHNYKGK